MADDRQAREADSRGIPIDDDSEVETGQPESLSEKAESLIGRAGEAFERNVANETEFEVSDGPSETELTAANNGSGKEAYLQAEHTRSMQEDLGLNLQQPAVGVKQQRETAIGAGV